MNDEALELAQQVVVTRRASDVTRQLAKALIEARAENERRHGIGGELLIARRERDAAKALLAEIAACPLWRHEWKARTPYLVMPDLLWERIQAYRQEVAK